MITIDIDASRATMAQRTGTERYSYEVIAALDRIAPVEVKFRLYINGGRERLPPLSERALVRDIRLPRLWTHLRLGPASWLARPRVLFVPAHVVPLLHPPTVVTIHDVGYRVFPEAHTARRRLELELTTRWSLRAARRVIAVSQATKRDLVNWYGVHPDRITVAHLGLSATFAPPDDPQCVSAVRARYGLRRPYLLYIGTVQPRKNLVRVIEALAVALAAGYDLDLVIAGKRGWLSEPIEQRARELGVADRVRFTGYVADADLPALLAGALAFVFPSLYEGFGIPVLEAMACGAPVITSTISSLPEVAGDAALLVDPLDTNAIAATIMRLHDHDDLRADLRRRGFARVRQFTWEACAQRTLEVLLAV
ncbi:glycosyltransferase family 1 protein [Chloroflexus sp.]|uniref:glycosyltransferase family 4 protein n=1 Tax=Chloroflexus sp. TaxID=1904827 RepID=UPI00298F2221|nr:glycosyltransferase family 1 protein [Chloroflexus sp.]MDW8404874.1 glycosyltransferase family 1 protein [Chloroflexus sp.]